MKAFYPRIIIKFQFSLIYALILHNHHRGNGHCANFDYKSVIIHEYVYIHEFMLVSPQVKLDYVHVLEDREREKN